LYRKEHNDSLHRFSEAGKTLTWRPSQKLKAYLADQQTMEFDPDHIDDFIRYGFDKRKTSVSTQKTITYPCACVCQNVIYAGTIFSEIIYGYLVSSMSGMAANCSRTWPFNIFSPSFSVGGCLQNMPYIFWCFYVARAIEDQVIEMVNTHL
jgi:hypothetical protein